MKNFLQKINPAVDTKILILLSGIMWTFVGIMLLSISFHWLLLESHKNFFIFGAIGLIIGLLVHHFGFLKIVNKNLKRIFSLQGKRCIFSFMQWKNYILVAVMITMGILLRHSSMQKKYLSLVYTGIGLALFLSSIRYLRFFTKELF